MTGIREAIRGALGDDAFDAIDQPTTQMALAMNRLGKPFYEGTVPGAEVKRRRAVNKRARIARRASR